MLDGGEDERGISPVVGIALMIVLVVLLVVTTATMVLDMGSMLREPAPIVATDESVQVELQGNDTQHTLELIHQNGEQLSVDAAEIRVDSGTATQIIDLADLNGPALADGTWSTGERIQVDLNGSTICEGGGDTAEVSLIAETDGSASMLSSRTVPIERGQFLIDGDSVRATSDFTANVTFLGTGWSSPSYDAPVNVSVRVDESEEKTWENVRDSPSTVGSFSTTEQEAGTTISVVARGKTSRYGDWRTTSESENAEYLEVLRDGDPAPNYEADSGQQDVAAYADPFIDNGTIDLDDNQAIYLFDFNRQGTDDDTADYQDAVVLVSFFTQETETVTVHNDRNQQVVVCPAAIQSTSANSSG